MLRRPQVLEADMRALANGSALRVRSGSRGIFAAAASHGGTQNDWRHVIMARDGCLDGMHSYHSCMHARIVYMDNRSLPGFWANINTGKH